VRLEQGSTWSYPFYKRIRREIKMANKKFWWNPVFFVPQEKAMPHAPSVFPAFWRIAQQGYDLIELNNNAVEVVRNYAGLQLISTEKYSHIIMLDGDHIHPTNIADAFKFAIEPDPDERLVVAGLNFRRTEDYFPCVFREDEDVILRPFAIEELPQRAIMKTDYVGTGSICIDRRVFEYLRPPWFIKEYDNFFTHSAITGEDLLFCKMCKEAGIGVYLMTSLTSPHLNDRFIGVKKHIDYIKNGPAVGDSPLDC
jgi:hypothetical protein